jgi:hypothetical protein
MKVEDAFNKLVDIVLAYKPKKRKSKKSKRRTTRA